MQKINRPFVIRLICILGFLSVVISFPSIFSPFVKKQGDWFPALLGIIIASEFISTVGVWYMKKWGVFLYLVTTLIKQSIRLLMDDWSPMQLILPILFLGITLFFYKKMDDNL